ncbi:hypothetical protein AB0L57_00940 [Nocardia sp. NPDC052254]|uniref:hypothetical protein n=1 Tax=Nocardia sp. NPDC052254 TaxID=3155681 RepID=UPI003442568C
MCALDRGCGRVADALDIAAEVIRTVKIVVFAELAALAASYGAALTISVATSGLSLALADAACAAARKLCSVMEQMLLGYILSEVFGKAIEPLERTIDSFVNGTLRDATRDILGIPDSGSAGKVLRIDSDGVARCARILDDLADNIMCHTATFTDHTGALTFRMHSPAIGPPGVMPDSPTVAKSGVMPDDGTPHSATEPGSGLPTAANGLAGPALLPKVSAESAHPPAVPSRSRESQDDEATELRCRTPPYGERIDVDDIVPLTSLWSRGGPVAEKQASPAVARSIDAGAADAVSVPRAARAGVFGEDTAHAHQGPKYAAEQHISATPQRPPMVGLSVSERPGGPLEEVRKLPTSGSSRELPAMPTPWATKRVRRGSAPARAKTSPWAEKPTTTDSDLVAESASTRRRPGALDVGSRSSRPRRGVAKRSSDSPGVTGVGEASPSG